jgi:hypothetical protein
MFFSSTMIIVGLFLAAFVCGALSKELHELRIGGVFPLLDVNDNCQLAGAQRMVCCDNSQPLNKTYTLILHASFRKIDGVSDGH